MQSQDQLSETSSKKQGAWASLASDFRQLWTTITLGFLGGAVIGALSGWLSHAAFSGGYQAYGFAYLGTALFIALGVPAALFVLQRRKF